MKLCFLNVTEERTSKLYIETVRTLFSKIKRMDTEFLINAVKNGLWRSEDYKYPFFEFYNKVSIIEAAREAQKEGCDGILVGCFGEPAIRELRSVLEVPVVGIAEAGMHLAVTMGWKFGIITLYEREFVSLCENRIRENAMTEKAITNPVRRLTMPTLDLFTKGIKNPQMIINCVNEVADQAVADGAEVIVTGCAALGPFFTLKGISMVGREKVPIIDTVTAGFKTLEMIVDYRNVTGCQAVSRIGYYSKPSDEDIERLQKSFQYAL